MPGVSGAPRILVVDDQAAFRALLRRWLTGAGYIVDEADTGMAAVQAYRLCPADLVVLDVLMPGQDGLETLRALRTHDAEVPIIVMSAGGVGGADTYLRLARAFGASHTLPKPFAVAQLLSAITTLLRARTH